MARCKEFYDKVHEIDMKMKPLRENPDYINALKSEGSGAGKHYFSEYYNTLAEIELCEWYYAGIPAEEIADCIAFIHDMEDGTSAKRNVKRKVHERIKEYEKLFKECVMNNMFAMGVNFDEMNTESKEEKEDDDDE